jgi:hypothetical protein
VGWLRVLVLVLMLSGGGLIGADEAAAQKLEEYDYENLGLRAVGVDLVWVNAKDAKGAVGFGVRADLGLLGPYVRVMPRFAHWASDIEDQAVAKFERNLESLCTPPGCDVSLGALKRDYWILGLDLQWILTNPVIAPYLGVGADLYILNDSGDAIKGTFLDDAVVTAGLSGVGGVQFEMTTHIRLYGELRGTLVTSASNVAIYAGLAIKF